MKLPGTRYLDRGWNSVKTLLGEATLKAWAQIDMNLLLAAATELAAGARSASRQTEIVLDEYVELMFLEIAQPEYHDLTHRKANRHGDTAHSLAFDLLDYLRNVRPQAFYSLLAKPILARVTKDGAYWLKKPADLRKVMQDMFADLRFFLDAENFSVATGQIATQEEVEDYLRRFPRKAEAGKPNSAETSSANIHFRVSANRISMYLAIDTLFGEVRKVFDQWATQLDKMEVILGRPLQPGIMPIEARRMRTYDECKGIWLLNWDREQGRWKSSGKAGPIHNSNSFEGLRNKPEKIEEVLKSLQALESYESPMSTQHAGSDGLIDLLGFIGANVDDDEASPAENWHSPNDASTDTGGAESTDALGDDGFEEEQVTELTELGEGGWEDTDGDDPDVDEEPDEPQLDLPPGKESDEAEVEDSDPRVVSIETCLEPHKEALQIAIYMRFLPGSDLRPEWIDPQTGEGPTQEQLCLMLGVSAPTWRKRVKDAVLLFEKCLRSAVANLRTWR